MPPSGAGGRTGAGLRSQRSQVLAEKLYRTRSPRALLRSWPVEGQTGSTPGHRLLGHPTPEAHPIGSPPKTASSPGGDRKAPAAPIRAEKAGSPALTLCHQPAPWFSHRCRSQARPRKPGSQRQGPRGWRGTGTQRQGWREKKGEMGEERQSQSETRGTEREKEKDGPRKER